MKEFYIYERFKVNNVEAVRIVPLSASQIEMRKKPWGVVINDATYCGHVELRTMLGNIVDSYSGKYADANVRQDFALLLPEYDLFAIYSVDEDANFIYVQYIHKETGVPLLVRYAAIDETPVRLEENRDERWGITDIDQVSYYRVYSGTLTHYYNDVIVPLMRGAYIEIERMEATLYISIGHQLPLNIEVGKNGLKLTYPQMHYHKANAVLDEGVITHTDLYSDGSVKEILKWNTSTPEYLDQFTGNHWLHSDNRDGLDRIALLIQGVKSLINSE